MLLAQALSADQIVTSPHLPVRAGGMDLHVIASEGVKEIRHTPVIDELAMVVEKGTLTRQIRQVLRVATAEGGDDFLVGTYGIPVMVTTVACKDQIKCGKVIGGGAPRQVELLSLVRNRQNRDGAHDWLGRWTWRAHRHLRVPADECRSRGLAWPDGDERNATQKQRPKKMYVRPRHWIEG